MQRVLSYQTAMRINGERDVRAYISKSTCISLVFSVAFVTLVLGFLLGKFVADRQCVIDHSNGSLNCHRNIITNVETSKMLSSENQMNVNVSDYILNNYTDTNDINKNKTLKPVNKDTDHIKV